MLTEAQTKQIEEQAIEGYPNEQVWLLTSKGLTHADNIASDPANFFEVSKPQLLMAMKDGLLAVIHSHTNGKHYPSETDMRSQQSTAVPWGIVVTEGETCTPIRWWGADTPMLPLVGRGFCHGVADCYGLICDFYKTEYGIELVNFPREWDWWNNQGNLYVDLAPKTGFRPLGPGEEPQRGDMWACSLRSDVPCHGGVYLGDELILHHPSGKNAVDASKLSRKEPIHRWLEHITVWFRHEEVEARDKQEQNW